MGTLQVNGNISATGTIQATSFLGNATSATKLQTARTIQINLASTSGASFNGTADITPGVTGILPVSNGGTGVSTAAEAATVLLSKGTNNGNLNDKIDYGTYWLQLESCTNTPYGDNPSNKYGFLEVMAPWYNNMGCLQRYTECYSGDTYVRDGINGEWKSWTRYLSTNNYTDYTVTKTGSGASGTWGINVTGSSASCTGNAATATKLTSITESSDQASSSTVWRRLWMCYSDNTTGRPSYDDRFAIQTSTGTLKAPIFSGSLSGNATSATYVKDSYNNSNITITYGKAGQSSTSWLASWNGYELGAIQPNNITAGWASGASYSNSSNALASTGWGNSNFTYLQTSEDFYGNSGWSHYLISNHGDGSSYYNFVIALPFWSFPKYKRMQGGTAGSWYNFHTTENVIIQSSTPGAGFYGQIWLKI